MIFFDRKKKQVENLLRASRQDFAFDQENSKVRLMMAVNVRHLTKDDVRRLTFNPRTWPKYLIGTSIAGIAVVFATSVTFAANQSKPGDLLFSVQQLQNQVVLSLPLPADTKAQISTDIVAKRLKELDEIKTDPSDKAKVTAEVKAAQASIDQAAKLVPASSKSSKIVNQLTDLSTRHQQQLEDLSAKVNDDQLKNQIQQSVEDITQTRLKLMESEQQNIQGASTENQNGDNSSNSRHRHRSESDQNGD